MDLYLSSYILESVIYFCKFMFHRSLELLHVKTMQNYNADFLIPIVEEVYI